MKVGDKVEVRYLEQGSPAPLGPVAEAVQAGSDLDKTEVRQVTRPAEVLSVLSGDRACVRFADGKHMICRPDQIL